MPLRDVSAVTLALIIAGEGWDVKREKEKTTTPLQVSNATALPNMKKRRGKKK